MLKFLCDLCKSEISAVDFIAEVIVREKQNLFLPGQGGKSRIQAGVKETHLHLCKNCYTANIKVDK